MSRRIGGFGTILWTLLLGVALAGCGDDATGPEGMGTATVQMNRAGSGSASLAASTVSADPRFARVDVEQVAAIRVEVDTVELHRVGDGDGEENGEGEGPSAGWYEIGVTLTEPLDLMALSAEQTLTIAEGTVPAGTYNQLRFFFEGATVDFAEGFDPDGEGPLEPGATDVPLRIPSGDQTGIKVPGLSFEVAADAESEVTVSFDGGASVQNLVVTGNGEVLMTPVLTPEGGPPAGS